MRLLRSAVVVVALGVFSAPVSAAPILIDFETLADGEDLGAQFAGAGISFSGATALVSGAIGGSLNEIDFPPLSGNTVVFDSGLSGIRVDFAGGATSFSGYFTYASALTLTAFSGATELGSVTSLCCNLGANELLALAFAGGITHVTIVGNLAGSFTMDDLLVNTVDTQPDPVPEPGTLGLLLLGASVLAGRKQLRGFGRRRQRDAP